MSGARPRGFASDNSAGVHPSVLAAIAAVNEGHALAYGHDPYTQEIERRVASQFGERAQAFFVFNGSAANVLSLRAACRPWQGAICAETAHVNVDECGAPESVGGIKLLTVPAPDGKLTPDLAERWIDRIGEEHVVQPRVLTVSQSTELGTLYQPGELRALAEFAREHGLVLHVDGSRLTNAAAALESRWPRRAPPPAPTSSPSAGPRTGCWAARRSCSPIRTWPTASSICAS